MIREQVPVQHPAPAPRHHFQVLAQLAGLLGGTEPRVQGLGPVVSESDAQVITRLRGAART